MLNSKHQTNEKIREKQEGRWEEYMHGEKTKHASNPMPKPYTSHTPVTGSNSQFIEKDQGTLGLRYWRLRQYS